MFFDDLKKRFDQSFEYLTEDLFNENMILEFENVLIKIASFRPVHQISPESALLKNQLLYARKNNETDKRESLLIELYLALHRSGAGYSRSEDKVLENKKGLKWLPGGLMPLVFASFIIKPEDVFIDLGCGNGLQGTLLKAVAPHRKTRQVELSKKYLETGKIFVEALGLDQSGFSFENNDIGAADISDADFIYMYRPARPMGEGKLFYENLAEKFLSIKKNFYLLSVADCFEPFIRSKYIKIYSNDFLSIFYFEN
ncbi:MAG: hypothetical protein ACQEQS_09715 [Thermodesulfobacteriota bacterium]